MTVSDNLEHIYELSPEAFFQRCLLEFQRLNNYTDYDAFCHDQLEHLELLAEKYRNAVKANIPTKLTKDQFVKIKQYVKYFKQLIENSVRSFDELLEEAIKFKKIEAPVNAHHKESLKSLHLFGFNTWLQNNKDWEVGDEANYRRLLTPENFNYYLKDERDELIIQQLRIREEENQRKINWQEKDTRFNILKTMEAVKENDFEYKDLERVIQDSGCLNVNTGNEIVCIYTPELAFSLLYKLDAVNMDTHEECTLRKSDYIESFVEGYNEGIIFFKNEFQISNDILYAADNNFVKNLHFQYYHLENDDTHEGWQFVRKTYPFIITHAAVKKYGFYSGIVTTLYELMDKHPIPFKSFKDSCDYFSNHSDPKEGLNSEPEIEREDENYVLVNTIDEYLEEFKSQFKSESEYEKAKDALFNWFIAKKSYSGSPIFVKGRNKSKLAFVLGEIYRSEIDKPLSREFLQLIKSLFTTFSDEDLESKPINKTNLYKYLTTKTK